MHGLQCQTHDRAANMSGKHAGAQALIKQEQSLALDVHCGAHCANLIAQKACLASVLIRDALDWVKQLVLLSQSDFCNSGCSSFTITVVISQAQ